MAKERDLAARQNGLGPNEGLIGRTDGRLRLTTPALVLDLDLFEANLATMAGLAGESGQTLRPHAKSHKCSAIAKAQIAAGAVGVCCASLREAEAMVAADVSGVHLTSPVVGEAKVGRLAALAVSAPDLSVVADHPKNVAEIDAAVGGAGAHLRMLVDIDPGMGRTGVTGSQSAVALARDIDGATSLSYAGVQAYSGIVQHIEDYAARREAYGPQLDGLKQTCDALTEAGLPPEIVTGGGTGSNHIDREMHILNELQVGSYPFMDVEYNAVELLPDAPLPFETALTMRCSVVSNNTEGFVTIDGGFKCFATDGPEPVVASGAPVGAVYTFMGDEHGRLTFAKAGENLELGAAVELVTPHCDPTVNLHDFIHCVRGDTVADIWPIDARGCCLPARSRGCLWHGRGHSSPKCCSSTSRQRPSILRRWPPSKT